METSCPEIADHDATIFFANYAWFASTGPTTASLAFLGFKAEEASVFTVGLLAPMPAGIVPHFAGIGDFVPLTVKDGFGIHANGAVVLRVANSNEGLHAYSGPSFDVVGTPCPSVHTGSADNVLFGIGADFNGVRGSNDNQAGKSLAY